MYTSANSNLLNMRMSRSNFCIVLNIDVEHVDIKAWRISVQSADNWAG